MQLCSRAGCLAVRTMLKSHRALLVVTKCLRFLRTVRYLKLSQITNRIIRNFSRPIIYVDDIPTHRAPTVRWKFNARQPTRMISAKAVKFLNCEGSAVEWHDSSKDRLWLYNLHYFDDLVCEGAEARELWHRTLLNRWVAENTPGEGIGWEPYPASLRVVNWVKWLLSGNKPEPFMESSLFQQANFLNQQLEFHLRGNHLIANAKALVFAGCYFTGGDAQAWLRRGLSILDKELSEQVLSDGAHFELSPMYHSIILVDLLDLIQLRSCYAGNDLEPSLPRLETQCTEMLKWLTGILHPDGDIPFFNDCAFGIAPHPSCIRKYADQLGVSQNQTALGIGYFEESGFCALRHDEHTALINISQIKAGYIPGHAHAESLSFEWSVRGERFVVNTGTSAYEAGKMRSYERGTSAHNTVIVDAKNSTEVWGSFRVGSRARVCSSGITSCDDKIKISAVHDGFSKVFATRLHRRSWVFGENFLQLTDEIEGTFAEGVSFIHLHPRVEVSLESDKIWLTIPSIARVDLRVEGGDVELIETYYSPQFGLKKARESLRIRFKGSRVSCEFTIV